MPSVLDVLNFSLARTGHHHLVLPAAGVFGQRLVAGAAQLSGSLPVRSIGAVVTADDSMSPMEAVAGTGDSSRVMCGALCAEDG